MACCYSQHVCACNFIGFQSHDEFRIDSRCSLQEHSYTEGIIDCDQNPLPRIKMQESKRLPPKMAQALPQSIRRPFNIWLLHPSWIGRRLLCVRSKFNQRNVVATKRFLLEVLNWITSRFERSTKRLCSSKRLPKLGLSNCTRVCV